VNLETALTQTATFSNPPQLDRFRQHIPMDWIDEALAASGVATVRKRRLPAEVVVWIVVAIALFRNRSIADVVSKLDLALPSTLGRDVATSGIIQARQRLGADPVARLFHRSATEWAHASAAAHPWRGLSLYVADGSSLRLPDTPENRQYFGGQPSSDGTVSSYPLARVVAVMAVRSHILADVAFGPYDVAELTYADALWDSLPANSLTILDKGFLGAHALLAIEREGASRHWLTRAKSNTKWTVIQTYAPSDLLVEMEVSDQARRKDEALPKVWRARAVRYQRKGFQPSWLLTSLLDPVAYPASELVALYHERWEIELGYDEVKTEMLDRKEAIRSKTPESVNQELWGVFLAYNLLRVEIERIAAEAGVEPTRISFVGAMRMIADEWLWCAVASPGAIPKHLARLRQNVKRLVLPARRSERRYARTVKLRTSHYPKNKRATRLQTSN
jgi:hypothetical protein